MLDLFCQVWKRDRFNHTLNLVCPIVYVLAATNARTIGECIALVILATYAIRVACLEFENTFRELLRDDGIDFDAMKAGAEGRSLAEYEQWCRDNERRLKLTK